MVLETTAFWPTDGRLDGLRRELEGLLPNVTSLDAQAAHDYCCAIEALSRQMPNDIDRIYRGQLAELIEGATDLDELRRQHPDWDDARLMAHWKATHGPVGHG